MISPIRTYDEFMWLATNGGLLELNVYEEYTVRKGDPILVFESYDNLYNALTGQPIVVNSINVRAVREYTYKLTVFKLSKRRVGHIFSRDRYFTQRLVVWWRGCRMRSYDQRNV